MDFIPRTGFTHGSERRISSTQFHSRVNEQHYHNISRDNRRDYYYHLWSRVKQVVRRQHNPLLSNLGRNSRFRFNLQHDNGWLGLLTGSRNKSGESGNRTHRDRKNYRNGLYYCLLISLLSVAPVKAAEGETHNTSNPVAAATGNVTNSAIQFQNNGAPSRQHYGGAVSCNGATMTFSPFYMGNHTVPFDEEMSQRSYTLAENWGGQINFMVPLDREGLRQCRRIAARQEEKMRLDYELVRVLKCSDLQRKGFMLAENSRVYDMCSDVVPIVEYQAKKKAAVKQYLKKECTPKEGLKLPWKEQEYECKTKSNQQ